MKRSIVLAAFIFLNMNGCKQNPVDAKSENHRPEIFSLLVFPDTIGPLDSAIVICNAMDPDGDTLVYDWITDARVRLKGALANTHSIFHTFENYRVVYPTQYVNTPIDTPWIQCFARDGKGKSANAVVRFVVRLDERR